MFRSLLLVSVLSLASFSMQATSVAFAELPCECEGSFQNDPGDIYFPSSGLANMKFNGLITPRVPFDPATALMSLKITYLDNTVVHMVLPENSLELVGNEFRYVNPSVVSASGIYKVVLSPYPARASYFVRIWLYTDLLRILDVPLAMIELDVVLSVGNWIACTQSVWTEKSYGWHLEHF